MESGVKCDRERGGKPRKDCHTRHVIFNSHPPVLHGGKAIRSEKKPPLGGSGMALDEEPLDRRKRRRYDGKIEKPQRHGVLGNNNQPITTYEPEADQTSHQRNRHPPRQQPRPSRQGTRGTQGTPARPRRERHHPHCGEDQATLIQPPSTGGRGRERGVSSQGSGAEVVIR
ncbi:MAG: hypothetical protein RLZZ408_970 [Verrucomicrobiota bacterium]